MHGHYLNNVFVFTTSIEIMSPYPPFKSDFFCGPPVALLLELYNLKLSVVQDIKTMLLIF